MGEAGTASTICQSLPPKIAALPRELALRELMIRPGRSGTKVASMWIGRVAREVHGARGARVALEPIHGRAVRGQAVLMNRPCPCGHDVGGVPTRLDFRRDEVLAGGAHQAPSEIFRRGVVVLVGLVGCGAGAARTRGSPGYRRGYCFAGGRPGTRSSGSGRSWRRHDLSLPMVSRMSRGGMQGHHRVVAEVGRADGWVPLQGRQAVDDHAAPSSASRGSPRQALRHSTVRSGRSPHAAHLPESSGTFSGGRGPQAGMTELSQADDHALQRIPVVPRIDYLRHDSLLSPAALPAPPIWMAQLQTAASLERAPRLRPRRGKSFQICR